MSKPKVVIIDYGVGNLLSVQRAVEACGAEWITSSEPNVIAQADRIILPGVGAFANGMQALELLGLIETIKAVVVDGTPVMGICLGMQLLLSESEEYGLTKGLGIIPGRVVQIPALGTDGARMKIPHIGWNSLVVSESATWHDSVMRNLTPGDAVYFAHSFEAEPADSAMRIAECFYGGCRISAVIASKNVVGCQFHPEKSGEIGLKIIKDFLNFQPSKPSF